MLCVRERVGGREGNRMRLIVLKGKNLVGREETLEDGEKGRHGCLLLERSDASIFLDFLRKSPQKSIGRTPLDFLRKSPQKSIGMTPLDFLRKSPQKSIGMTPLRLLRKSPQKIPIAP